MVLGPYTLSKYHTAIASQGEREFILAPGQQWVRSGNYFIDAPDTPSTVANYYTIFQCSL